MANIISDIFERHYYKPKSKHHYNGNIYLLTGGNSFSATTLFAAAVKGQKNVIIVGEETGGAAYGKYGVDDSRCTTTQY
jgi:C-terminal processing protease CtpA/Prc